MIELGDKKLLRANLERHVDRLAGLIGPRHVGRPAALAASATFIERELAHYGYGVRRQTYSASGIEVANLIAELPGRYRAKEIVILGAHYDTIPATPGADDNASAVAVLLEIARLLRNMQSRRTVRFVAFACEEMPHFHSEEMGSQVHARRARAANEEILGMLCLEMVGYYTSFPGSQRLPPGIPRLARWLLPRRGDFLAAVANPRSWRLLLSFRRGFSRATRFALLPIVLPERIHEIRRSDNSSFWDQNFPALMLTDTSFLRNPHYHLPSDTPDTLDYDCMVEVTIGVAGAIRELADGGRVGGTI